MSYYLSLFILVSFNVFVFCESSCVVYNFENDYEDLFTSNSSLCSNFGLWKIGTYTNVNIARPHGNSNKFIEPNAVSCVTSFALPMEAGGTIEVKLYMSSNSPNDFVSIITNAINPSGNDPTVASYMYHSAQPDFVNGWHVMRTTIVGIGSFDGYVSFLGSQSEGSQILIDSFRYIPPFDNIDGCLLYEDIETATSSLTDPNADADEDEEKCVTYNFETSFDELFTPQNRLCDDFVAWTIGNYSSIGMSGANGNSEFFMTPKEDQSCMASFPFEMTPGGIVEVNLYVEPVTKVDHVIVLAKKLVPESVDTVAGLYIYEPSRASFVTGWNVIRISVADLTKFKGYLVFLGSASEDATVLVDSFRYIPPSITEDNESCAIY